MAEAKPSTARRDRGRPQLRPDDETRQIIYEAARHAFAANGYAATSTETVARGAGVSTKTLYRLVPNKAALFEGMVSDRLDRFLSDFNLQVPEDADIEAGLNAALMAYADLGLDPDVVALQRIILQETGQFPALAAAFYNNGIVRTAAALTKWLRLQVKRGLIDLDNPEEAAGILIGMVASAPQRAAIYGGVPLPSRAQLKARVRKCVKLFLHGCEAHARAG
ncbi:TetR/AcrR family transcriptional regulator [Bradyrhizobium sp. SRL28]|uniref:TetR/AcrR family transcriptional regulator n=1 Tax=Bradyrhizobium sp. SRL28 TaxID=2836178 RepID=UPI001BDDEAEC|nr:TetR/AcrR family transcriptional regulator [Bradyrhizobium sp. SRL28]MBT1514119.1 TetR/AcrR family transcriptional regulator [Bradyrhizobium sp. SRL28]